MPCHGCRRLTSAEAGQEGPKAGMSGQRAEINSGDTMRDDTQRFIIVTGGPGAGKTTLITELARHGIATSPEAGRAVIREQRGAGGAGLPWADRELFAELMFASDLKAYEAARAGDAPVVFDRGIPDVIGYLRLCGLDVPSHLDQAARRLRYRREVFIAPPWRGIFENDEDRLQDFDEACRTYEVLAAIYREYGYELSVLPLADVATRARLVLERIRA